MKIKTINKVISKKFEDFCTSITDENTRKLVQKNSLISGGCIASMLLREDVNDFDVYFTNKETALAVANYYAEKMRQTQPDLDVHVVDVDSFPTLKPEQVAYYEGRGFSQPGRIGIFCKDQKFETETTEGDLIDLMEKAKEDSAKGASDGPKYRIMYASPNALSLSNSIQLILRFYGTPEEIHSNYDFAHCTNYWLSEDGKLHLNQRALESILTKDLLYVGSKYPICSMIRIRKFINRGWTCNAGNHLKIAYQISKLDLESVPTLEDQLIGVDVGYFIAFISAMKNAQNKHEEEGKTFVITYDYISEIIDRIFND